MLPQNEFHLAIVGTRTFTNKDFFNQMIDNRINRLSPNTILWIVTGDAPGADQLAREYCASNVFIQSIVCYAKWELYGNKAGPIRNANIIEHADELIAFWDHNSKGTKNTIDLAQKKGIPVTIYAVERKD